MTDTTTQPVKPKMSLTKKIFWAIGIVLSLFAVDHFTCNIVGIGAAVTVTDSTLVVSPIADTMNVDTAKAITPVIDTAKKVVADTSSKKVIEPKK